MIFHLINKIYRVSDWFYYLGFTLLGFLFRSPIEMVFFKYIIVVISLLAYAFSYNDYWDKNLKKKYFLLPLLFSFFSFIFLNVIEIVLIISFLAIFTFYSGRPIKLKSIPIIGTLCNGIGFSLLFLLGYRIIDFIGLLFFLLFFCFNIIAQLIHEVVHMEQDKENGFKTTVIFLGNKNITKICIISFFFIILISGCLFHLGIVNNIFLSSTIIFCLFFIYEMKNGVNRKLRIIYKIAGITLGFIYLLSFTMM